MLTNVSQRTVPDGTSLYNRNELDLSQKQNEQKHGNRPIPNGNKYTNDYSDNKHHGEGEMISVTFFAMSCSFVFTSVVTKQYP